ncbi:hypothetical protein JW949_04180 [Candidatus Woesearchaeota archaeon]|nr:hypothetical protein [Candidatus Woesearchaeota archaeon]
MEEKIKNLLKTSKEVIKNCSLENGAIIAADTDKPYYPKTVTNYRFVWPRDASFTICASELLGIKNIKELFLKWLITRAEHFSESGMLFQRYDTHGRRNMGASQYQPDQAGALLWVLTKTNENLNKETKEVIKLLADGICKNWGGKHFNIDTYDLWEERRTFPSLEDNFSYTLAACSFGLKKAYEKLGDNKWLKVSQEMKKTLEEFKGDYYCRLWGKIPDKRIDASVLGLVWPFNILKKDKKLLNSIEIVKKKLLTEQGIKRYENDEYGGRVENLSYCKKGGGGWPILTFWYIIALSEIGQKEESKKIFEKYIRKFEKYIPEQLFDNNIQESVSPLCWSHSMFIIASEKLGYLK